MTNYLFWRNRQGCCFSLSSIFISSSLLSGQCWLQYIKCIGFQWNCHYKGFQGSSDFLWAQNESGVCSSLSTFPALLISQWWPEQAPCLPCHPSYHPGYLVFVSVAQWVVSYFIATWKGQQPVSTYELTIKYTYRDTCFNHLWSVSMLVMVIYNTY